MMAYLRSVLSNNFLEDEDHSLIMMTCPRIIRYELLVVDFAQKLLRYHGEQVLFKRSSLEKDM